MTIKPKQPKEKISVVVNPPMDWLRAKMRGEQPQEWEKEFDGLFEYEDMDGGCACNKYKVLDFILALLSSERAKLREEDGKWWHKENQKELSMEREKIEQDFTKEQDKNIKQIIAGYKKELVEKLNRFGGFCPNCRDRFVDIITKTEHIIKAMETNPPQQKS